MNINGLTFRCSNAPNYLMIKVEYLENKFFESWNDGFDESYKINDF